MRDPLLRPFSGSISGSDSSTDSWLYRVRENLAQLLLPSHFKPSSANGAPIHLLKFEKSPRPARAQGASLLTHIAIFAAVIYLVANQPTGKPPFREGEQTPLSAPPRDFLRAILGPRVSDAGGSGGNNDPIPAKHGDLPPYSQLVLVKPSIRQSHDSQAPIPPTLFDPNAPPILAPTPNIGLPWMNQDNNSGGPGPGHTIGANGGDNMGDRGPGPAGDGENIARYGPNYIAPMCAYCPYPTYSDDARKAKVQGAVTLQVLVGADGRAQDIRIVKGIGFGLDERAMETVRDWKFIPARDSAKHNVPAWVTVEAVFRLF